ncbi:helix-turn-helix transcriptional regulator [Rhodococcus sp. SGAir0479]|uniref:helix-turn-helix transcriptional regulator n=1 Tax=Rhodococcus sp. SGAir0479 TaxID=2567884 RepID=UPI0010CCF8FB|nr:LuxR family transcriptional regulator [Rhodococcus sp. SGAir0479]QCQ93427.1 LuxR family transcriptional regulator [Rhodococcus sp. SGAir0479]
MTRRGASGRLRALRAAIDTQDWEAARTVLLHNWTGLVADHLEDVRAALLAFPAPTVESDPLLRAAREMFVGRGVTTRFDRVLPNDPDELDELGTFPDAPERLAIGTVQASLLRFAGNMQEAADLIPLLERVAVAAVRAQPDSVTGSLPILRLQWAITCQLAGRRDESTALFRRANFGAEALGMEFVVRNSAGSIALNHVLSGEIGAARTWLERWEQTRPSEGRLEQMVRVSGLVAHALVALEDLDLDAAADRLRALGEIREGEELWAYALYAHCQYALLAGKPQQGLDLVDRLRPINARWWTPDSDAQTLLGSVVVDLQCALGRGNAARAALAGNPSGHPLTRVSRARYALLTGDPETALTEAVRVAARDGHGPRARLDALLLEAAASARLGNPDAARAAWTRATDLAHDVGTVRPFALLPAAVAQELDEAGLALPTDRAADADRVPIFPDRVPVVELSAREQLVLSALADGKSVAAAAAELFVSPNTVKSQMRSIFKKLDAHTRDEALRTAVLLELL